MHQLSHGPRVNLSRDITPDDNPLRWTMRCPRCGREAYTVEQLNQQPCKDST